MANDYWNLEKIPSYREHILEIRKKRKEKITLENDYGLKNASKIKVKEDQLKKIELDKKKQRKELLYDTNSITALPRKKNQTYKTGKFDIPFASVDKKDV